jgi:hypothetical protein
MRELTLAFICLAGGLTLTFWALALILLARSGRGLSKLFTRPRRAWLPLARTASQYSDDLPEAGV